MKYSELVSAITVAIVIVCVTGRLGWLVGAKIVRAVRSYKARRKAKDQGPHMINNPIADYYCKEILTHHGQLVEWLRWTEPGEANGREKEGHDE